MFHHILIPSFTKTVQSSSLVRCTVACGLKATEGLLTRDTKQDQHFPLLAWHDNLPDLVTSLAIFRGVVIEGGDLSPCLMKLTKREVEGTECAVSNNARVFFTE